MGGPTCAGHVTANCCSHEKVGYSNILQASIACVGNFHDIHDKVPSFQDAVVAFVMICCHNYSSAGNFVGAGRRYSVSITFVIILGLVRRKTVTIILQRLRHQPSEMVLLRDLTSFATFPLLWIISYMLCFLFSVAFQWT